MIACRLSLTANDFDEKLLKKVFDQISRDIPVGRDQHKEDLALAERALPFETELMLMTEKHPKLLNQEFFKLDLSNGNARLWQSLYRIMLRRTAATLDYVAFG